MMERLRALAAEYADLQKRMQDPAVFGDHKEVARIGKRLAELKPLVDMIAEYDRCQRAVASVDEVGDDPELRELAQQDAAEAAVRLEQLQIELQQFLVPKDPDDDRNVILEVRAGTGGDEASLFAAELLRMYLRFAEIQGWKADIINKAITENGGLKEAVLKITGDGAYGLLKFESGVHRVQRVPETESKGRIHTSTATVAILPEAEDVDITVRTEDLRIDTFRASGAGGQHVNKTESAIRITHLPTNVVVECQTERSQIRNREIAMDLLRSRLYAAKQEELAKERGEMRSGQIGGAERSEKIRTYNFPQDRVTDHRIGENFSNLPSIMEGNILQMLEVLRMREREERLKAAEVAK
jgi:peptide chain release factor 1